MDDGQARTGLIERHDLVAQLTRRRRSANSHFPSRLTIVSR